MDWRLRIAIALTLFGFLASICDANQLTNKIFKGRVAKKSEMLYVTWLEYQGAVKCSGSLIGEEWVLTAARCVYNTDLADYRVAVGDVIIGKLNDGQQFFTPDTFYLHPDYNNDTKVNDVALIRLPIALDTSISTLAMVPSLMADSLDDIITNKDTCVIGGFGETAAGTPASRKIKLTMKIGKDGQCRDVTGYDNTMHLCVKPKKKTAKTCKGDEGGPILCDVNGTTTQVGMVWDGSCENSISAGIKMSAYLGWIEGIIASNSYERCPSLPSITGGNYIAVGPTTVNSVAQLQCDRRFTLTSGDATVMCQSGGSYTAGNASCGCGIPSAISNGNFTSNADNAIGDTAVLSCLSGYESSSADLADNTITCRSTGSWTSPSASCVIMCPAPTPAANATFQPDQSFYSRGNTTTLVCDSGFVRSVRNDDKATITCRKSGRWSNSNAYCQRSCGGVPTAVNGTFESSSSDMIVGDTAVLKCDSGFIRSVSNDTEASITCESSGDWSSTSAICIESCGTPASVSNGTLVSNGTNFGDTATLSCDSGFVSSSDNISDLTITCENTGEWSSLTSSCLRTCGYLPTSTNGTFTPNTGLLVNDSAVLACDSGFVRSTTNDTEATITCETDGSWSSTSAYCIRSCMILPSSMNGTFETNSTDLIVNDTAVLACDANYVRSTTVDADATITCGSDGQWTPTYAICIRSCGVPPSALNSTFNSSSSDNIVNDTAVLGCDSQYVRSTPVDSNATITCESDGQWTSTDAYCIRSCLVLPSALNGTFETNSTDLIVNDTAVLSCDSEYVRSTTVDSDATVICGSDGQWTPTSAYCIRSCLVIPSAFNGTFETNSTDLIVNDTAVLSCDSEYVRSTTVDSDATVTCGIDGQWTPTSANCIRSCLVLPSAVNGTFETNSTDLVVNDTAVLSCDSEYVRSTTLDSDATVSCGSDGQWTPTSAYCIRSCLSLPSALNGTFETNSTDLIVNDTAVLSCDSEYVRSTTVDSDATVTCGSDGQWTSTSAYCIRSCLVLPSAVNGTFETNSTDLIVNDTAVLSCDSEYVRSTTVDFDATVTCDSDGQWTPTSANCIRSCLVLPSAFNGTFETNSTDLIVNDTAVLSCDSEYVRSTTVDSDATVTCGSDGQWTSTSANCIRSCGLPPLIAFGAFGDNMTSIVNDTVELSCDTGYTRSTAFVAEASTTCQESGNWSTSSAYCVASCDTYGTSFTTGFFKNVFSEGTGASIYGSAIESSEITITIPFYNFEQVAEVTDAVRFSLPNDLGTESQEISNKIIYITSTKPMTFFLYHIRDSSVEGTIIFPDNCAGKDYMMITHDSVISSDIPSESVTVGLVDGTSVTITEHLTGVTRTVVINRFDLLHHSAEDLSGTTVSASENVHVLAGHRCAQVPDTSVGRCDYLIESMPLISSLRRAYLLSPQKPRVQYSVRVVASYDGTEVSFWTANGTLKSTAQLDKMESHFQSFYENDTISITANNDVLVAQYGHGFEADRLGDPSYVVIPSLTQFLNVYALIVDPELFRRHYITIIIKDDDDISGLRVSNNTLKPLSLKSYDSIYVPGVGSYKVLHEQLISPDTEYAEIIVTHVNSTVEFGAVQYGFSPRIGYALVPGRNIPTYTDVPLTS